MSKNRVAVVLSFSFSVRYIVRTGLLKMMHNYCEPVIILTWLQQDLVNELLDAGFEVHITPENKRGSLYNDIRRKVDIWFRYFSLKSPSRDTEQAYLDLFRSPGQKLLRLLRVYFNVIKLYTPGYQQRLLFKENKLLHEDTNLQELISFVLGLNIEAVFTVTPFHQQEDILLRACKLLGKRMICSILSFDNITKRGWIPVEYDAYMVWNEDNMHQLFRIYPRTREKRVFVTGAAQFDFYFQKEYILSYVAWQQLIGIPAENKRKVILYSGGPQTLFPQEPLYLKAIDVAIREGRIKDQPLVLFRCHPIDNIERWKKAVGDSPNIVFDISWTGNIRHGYANVTEFDIQKLNATLAYTDVHVNICSTMTVDGAAFLKPQIGPAYMPGNMKGSRVLMKLYEQEHFLPVTQSGVLKLALSEASLIQLLNDALKGAKPDSAAYDRLLKKIISYTDGRNTERVSDSLQENLLPG